MGLTHLSALQVAGTVQARGVTATGAASSLKSLSVSGTVALNGKITIPTDANGYSGIRTIATGGSSVIANTSVRSTSRIIVSARTTITKASAKVLAVTGSVSFKVGLFTGAGTAATGAIHYQIVN
jgi:hypothetical protein